MEGWMDRSAAIGAPLSLRHLGTSVPPSMRAKLVTVTMRVEMSVVGESHSSASENIAAAERVAYLYVAPVILTVGILGSAANLLVLSNKRRFDGRLYVYLRVRVMDTWYASAQARKPCMVREESLKTKSH